jgi:hypothetical protein
MTILLPDLPETTRNAIHHAAAALVRSRAVLAAANLSADRASDRVKDAGARASLLQARMAEVKYARRTA